MRFHWLSLILVIGLGATAAGQESQFPALDALEKLQVPAYDYADMVSRLSAYNPTVTLPTHIPIYQVGDRKTFNVVSYDDPKGDRAATELRGMTENVLIWVEEDAAFYRGRAQALAEHADAEILAPLRQLLDYREPSGIDGDPRLHIVTINRPGFWAGGYFDIHSTVPREINPKSNLLDILVINLVYDDGSLVSDEIIQATIAHEYQHHLLHYRDRDEESWLNEALAVFAEYYIVGSEVVSYYAESFLEAPHTKLTTMYTTEELYAEYGAVGLFLIYIAEQFGYEALAQLHAEAVDGWPSVDKALREYADASAAEVFADWVLANYFMYAEGGYGYQNLETVQVAAQPSALLSEFPARHSGSLSQYSSEYLAVSVRGADKLSLQLTQDPFARLFEAATAEGDNAYYAVTSDRSNSRLTRSIDLFRMRPLWLEYQIWHDLEEHREYAYVEVSKDGGETWDILQGQHTQDNRGKRFYADGYTGKSGGWLQERIDLGDYGGRRILLRFEVYTDKDTSYRGLAIDDLRIDAIGLHDGFEEANDAWQEEGWFRTDNHLPQQTWVQVAQETPEELHVTRALMTESGEMLVDLQPDAWAAHIAISPIVPRSSLNTDYSLEVRLLDTEGAPMTAALECRVTTTHGLNHRAVPNGQKIGLLPQGATVTALDRRQGWYRVAYDGNFGWISGDYTRAQGDCA